MPASSGRIRDFGYATTKEDPINRISRGGNEEILALLEQLMGQKGAPRELADLLVAIKAGVGTANIVRTPDIASAQRQANDPFTYGRDATGPTKGFAVGAGPGAAFAITPSGNTLDVGRALNQGSNQAEAGQSVAERDQFMNMFMKLRKRDKSRNRINTILGGL